MNQFNRTYRTLKLFLADGRVTQRERRSLKIRDWRLHQMTVAVFNSQTPQQTLDAIFRGKNPTGTDAPTLSMNHLQPDELTGLTYINTHQGTYNTCTILAAGIGFSKYWTNPNRTTTFHFSNSGISEIITVTNHRPLTGSAGFGGLLERAYAAYLQRTGRVRDSLTAWEEATEGNYMDEAIEAFYGPSVTVNGLTPTNSVQIRQQLDLGKPVLFAQYEGNDFVSPVHAYRVVGLGSSLLVKDPRVAGAGFLDVPLDRISPTAFFTFEG